MINNNYIVYKHTSPNNKVYIGITGQKPERRWRNGEAYKHHKYFYNAIKKYGWDNFHHDILFTGLSKEKAEQKEIELIKQYNSNNTEYGYNRSTGGESGSIGYIFTDEQRKHLSDIRKGEKNAMYGRRHTEETIERERITHMRKNLSQSTIDKMSAAKKGKKRDRSAVEKQIRTISNKVICLETNSEYISAKQAGISNGIDPSCITKVCRGERKTAGGYHWCYGGD